MNRPAAGAATMASPPVKASMAAGTRIAVRTSTSRTGSCGELIGPLLFLEVGDRGRIIGRPLGRVRQCRLFVGEDSYVAKAMAIGEARRVHDQRPAITSGRGWCSFDAEGSRAGRLRTRQRAHRAAALWCELDPGPAGVQRLEVVEPGQMHGEQRRASCDQRRVLHVEFGLLRPAGHVQGRRVSVGRVGASAAPPGHDQRNDGSEHESMLVWS